MPNKVREFPQPKNRSAKMPADEPMVLFALGDQRFPIQWILTQVNRKPAQVIPIQKERPSRT
jgi:hypothetical protein